MACVLLRPAFGRGGKLPGGDRMHTGDVSAVVVGGLGHRRTENMPKQFVAITGGGDWADASVEFLVFETPITTEQLEAAKKERDRWYAEEYCAGLRGDKPKVQWESFTTFVRHRFNGRDVNDEDTDFLAYHED